MFRQWYDDHVQNFPAAQSAQLSDITQLTSHLLYFYNDQTDGQRLVSIVIYAI